MEIMARLDWSEGRDVHAQPANVVLVQSLGEEIILSLGHAPPPIATATLSGDDLVKFFEETTVPVQGITRFTLPVSTSRVLAKGLEQVLKNRQPDAEEES